MPICFWSRPAFKVVHWGGDDIQRYLHSKIRLMSGMTSVYDKG